MTRSKRMNDIYFSMKGNSTFQSKFLFSGKENSLTLICIKRLNEEKPIFPSVAPKTPDMLSYSNQQNLAPLHTARQDRVHLLFLMRLSEHIKFGVMPLLCSEDPTLTIRILDRVLGA